MMIKKATFNDLEEILKLQKIAYISEAKLYDNYSIEPLKQTIDDIKDEFNKGIILKAVNKDLKIIGSVRAYKVDRDVSIQKLIVDPNFQNEGIGKNLLACIEKYFINIDYNSSSNNSSNFNSNYSNIEFKLFTGYKSSKNLYLYKKLGYIEYKSEKISKNLSFVHLKKN